MYSFKYKFFKYIFKIFVNIYRPEDALAFIWAVQSITAENICHTTHIDGSRGMTNFYLLEHH